MVNVLIPDGDNRFSLFVTQCLGRIDGIRVHMLFRQRSSPARFSRYLASVETLPRQGDGKATLQTIMDVVKRRRIDVILPVAEEAHYFVGRTREVLRSRCLPVPVAAKWAMDIAVDKGELAQFLSGHGIPVPATVQCATPEALRRALPAIEYPALLKPVGGRSGAGILYLADRESAQRVLEEGAAERVPCILQRYIVGDDIDCSVLCSEGRILASTIQRGVLPPARRFAPPSAIEFLHDEQVLRTACRTMGALGWSGVAHIDMRRERATGQCYILEINPRYWSSLWGSLAAGVNFPHLICRTALGEHYPVPSYEPVRYISRRTTALRCLLFRRFRGPDFDRTVLTYSLRDPLALAVDVAQESTLALRTLNL